MLTPFIFTPSQTRDFYNRLEHLGYELLPEPPDNPERVLCVNKTKDRAFSLRHEEGRVYLEGLG